MRKWENQNFIRAQIENMNMKFWIKFEKSNLSNKARILEKNRIHEIDSREIENLRDKNMLEVFGNKEIAI